MSKLQTIITQFEKAIAKLDDVLQQEKNEYIRDSAVKRFEFVFDLSWKVIKIYLYDEKGIVCNSPKGCFREAYKQGLIEYDDFWLKMTDWRNETTHTYNENTAENVYKILPQMLGCFQKLLKSVKNEKN